MKLLIKSTFSFYLFFSISSTFAAGEISFPSDWKSWQSVTTPLTQIGALPGCDADVSSLPVIYQVTVESYCAVRPQGPGAVDVLVKPTSMASYKLRDGKLEQGPNMILQLKDLGLLMVTGHDNGEAKYAVFKEDGTDVSESNPESILSPEFCRSCHTGYAAFCVNGQCGAIQ